MNGPTWAFSLRRGTPSSSLCILGNKVGMVYGLVKGLCGKTGLDC